ncbi:MAG TPA: hypothetical protein VGP06_07225, partial [Janthinobacterium sp.]|nr:hypothetical protein [Janthinobacterium sp.]
PLPIPNRTVKRYCADDSAATSVKVGHRQACHSEKPRRSPAGFFYVGWFYLLNPDTKKAHEGLFAVCATAYIRSGSWS